MFVVRMFYGPAEPVSKQISWTRDACRTSIKHMRVDHRCLHVAVAEQLLDGSNVRATFQQMGGKAMAKSMAAGGFTDPNSSDCSVNRPLNDRGVEMMAPLFPSLPIPPTCHLREYPLPIPLP